MGVTVFMISWVSTRMSFTQLSISWLASSPLMSLKPMMRTRRLLRVVWVSRRENPAIFSLI